MNCVNLSLDSWRSCGHSPETALPQDTPGHFNILLQRIRILGLLGRVDTGLRLAEEAIGKGLDRS